MIRKNPISRFNRWFFHPQKTVEEVETEIATITATTVPPTWKVTTNDKFSIVVKPEVSAKLSLMENAAKGNEFSGFGFGDRIGNTFVIYDVVLMDIGTYAYTEFAPEKILKLMDRTDHSKMKVFFHRHPLGNGIPGSHNWSGIDERTIIETPLGGIPELIEWSVSIVKTPKGWVGRIDNYLAKKTIHMPVKFDGLQEVYDAIAEITEAKQAAEIAARITAAARPAVVYSTPLTKSTWFPKDEHATYGIKNDDPKSIRDTKTYEEPPWDRFPNLGTSPLFDLDDYEEPSDLSFNENYIHDSFYELDDEIELQLKDVLNEVERLTHYATRFARTLKPMNQRKADSIVNALNQIYGRVTVLQDALITKSNDVHNNMLLLLEE